MNIEGCKVLGKVDRGLPIAKAIQNIWLVAYYELLSGLLICWVFDVWFPFCESSELQCVFARWFLEVGFR